jgi:hypothetical protein
MTFTAMVSGRPDFETRTSEYIACKYVEQVARGATMMGWLNFRELRAPT